MNATAQLALTASQRSTARSIARWLTRTANEYHAGYITHDEFTNANVRDWKAAESAGVAELVKRMVVGR